MYEDDGSRVLCACSDCEKLERSRHLGILVNWVACREPSEDEVIGKPEEGGEEERVQKRPAHY